MKENIRTVHKNWLWQRAKALETKLLKKYGKSMARISIDNRFNKCIKCSYVDEPIMEIDYNEYREICREIEEEYRGEQNAFDLINRLQADCENYKQVAEYQQSVTMDRGFEIKRLKEKIESLQEENERLKKLAQERHLQIHKLNGEIEELRNIRYLKTRAEAVTEFAYELKQIPHRVVHKYEIDNLLKAKVGDRNDG